MGSVMTVCMYRVEIREPMSSPAAPRPYKAHQLRPVLHVQMTLQEHILGEIDREEGGRFAAVKFFRVHLLGLLPRLLK